LFCVVMDAVPPYQTILRGVGSGFLSLVFPRCDGLSGVGRIYVVASPESWFVSSHQPLCPQDNLQLRSIISFQLTTKFSRVTKYVSDFPGGSCVVPRCFGTGRAAPSPTSWGSSAVVPYLESGRSAQCSVLSLPGRGELCSPSMATSFVGRGAIYPPAELDSVLPSRADGLWHSLVRLGQVWWGSCRLCPCVQDQDIAESRSVCSAVLFFLKRKMVVLPWVCLF
jgi:hypothetical protein